MTRIIGGSLIIAGSITLLGAVITGEWRWLIITATVWFLVRPS